MSEQQEYPAAIAGTQIAEEASAPMYFPVSASKLVVMSICTLGVYQIYWFYKNWRLVKERENSDIMPAMRAIFAYFFCYSLFKKIRDTAESQKLTVSFDASGMAAGWVIVSLLWRLPDPYWLITYANVFFIMHVQSVANAINRAANPDHDPNNRYSGWNIAAIVIGGIIFALAIIGTFFPED